MPANAAVGTAFESLLKENGLSSEGSGLIAGLVPSSGPAILRCYGMASKEHGIAASPGTPYEIASLSKTLTSALLTALEAKSVVSMSDRVVKFLPPGTPLTTTPEAGERITLYHLATQTSGLPRLPVNLDRASEDPYNGYPVERLYAGLPMTPLAHPVGSFCQYSNFGYGLLAHVLGLATGKGLGESLREHVFVPLGMSGSRLWQSGDGGDAAVGYADGRPATIWNIGSLAGAGQIVCPLYDLVTFLGAVTRSSTEANPWLHRTLRLVFRSADARSFRAIGWYAQTSAEGKLFYWHNGMCYGFTSFAAFSPARQMGLVLVSNDRQAGFTGKGMRLFLASQSLFGRQESVVEPNVAELPVVNGDW